MALTREEQLIELRVTGLADVKALEQSVRLEEDAIRLASDAHRGGQTSLAQYHAEVSRAAGAIGTMQEKIDRTNQALGRSANGMKSLRPGGSSNRLCLARLRAGRNRRRPQQHRGTHAGCWRRGRPRGGLDHRGNGGLRGGSARPQAFGIRSRREPRARRFSTKRRRRFMSSGTN